MQIELFLDDIDRDVFTSVNTSSAGGTKDWRKIYQDLNANAKLAQLQRNDNDKTGKVSPYVQILDRYGNHYLVHSRIFLRPEDGGGLLYNSETAKVFKLDTEAYEMMGILWVAKQTSYLQAKFPKDLVDAFIERLLDLDLLRRDPESEAPDKQPASA